MILFVERFKEGDAAVTASPKIIHTVNIIYGWVLSPFHIGQLPNPGPNPGPE
jgi:hypothetical protein